MEKEPIRQQEIIDAIWNKEITKDRSYNDLVNLFNAAKISENDLRLILGSGKILDCGCGEAKMVEDLQEKGFDAVGIDLGLQNPNIARSVQESAVATQIIAAKAEQLPFKDGEFGCVIDMWGPMAYSISPEQAATHLNEELRVLRKGGKLIINPSWYKHKESYLYSGFVYDDSREDEIRETVFEEVEKRKQEKLIQVTSYHVRDEYDPELGTHFGIGFTIIIKEK